jgi:hypothetical protein
LGALVAVFWWFQMRMLDGWTIAEQSAGALFEVYIVVIVATTFLEIVIAAMLSPRKSIDKDERDQAIEARANLNERLFMIGAVNVLIWQALWEGVLEGHALPKIDLTNLPTLFFFLFTILFAGEAVKRLSTIILYRVQSAPSS